MIFLHHMKQYQHGNKSGLAVVFHRDTVVFVSNVNELSKINLQIEM